MAQTAQTQPLKAESPFTRVLWAVDPFAHDPHLQAQAMRALRALVKEAPDCTIEPVYVASFDGTDLLAYSLTPDSKVFTETAEKNIKKLVGRIRLSGMKGPHLLNQTGRSTRHAVQLFLEYAKEKSADLIVVSTHARKGITRWFLGSFAETLMIQSRVPTPIVNPDARLKDRLRPIFFPTDFSSTSKVVFEQLVEIARATRSEVILFHKLEMRLPELAYPFAIPPVSEDSITERAATQAAEAERWLTQAERSGVKVKFQMSRSGVDIVTAITRQARRTDCAMIAMGSHSGSLSSALLGSITRQVIRQANLPVLVLHGKSTSAPGDTSLSIRAEKPLLS